MSSGPSSRNPRKSVCTHTLQIYGNINAESAVMSSVVTFLVLVTQELVLYQLAEYFLTPSMLQPSNGDNKISWDYFVVFHAHFHL